MARLVVAGAATAVAVGISYVAYRNYGSPFKLPTVAALMAPVFRNMIKIDALPKGEVGRDVTQQEVAEFEEKAWKGVEGKDWDLYQKHRPYHLRGHKSKAPTAGATAPDGPAFSITTDGYKPTTLLSELSALAKRSGTKLVAVSFDSLTCPVWRSYAGADLHNLVASAGLPVLHVYTLEAHAEDAFPMPREAGKPIKLAEPILDHKKLEERLAAAKKAMKLLEIRTGGPVNMILDSMDNTLENLYETRPFRMFIIEAATKKVAFAWDGPAPFNVPNKKAAISAFLSN